MFVRYLIDGALNPALRALAQRGRRYDHKKHLFLPWHANCYQRSEEYVEGVMTEPRKSVRIFMFIGLIALNIVLLAVVLQRALPESIPQAKNVDPTTAPITMDHSVFLPLVRTVYKDPVVLLPGDGVYYERDQDLQIVHVLGEVLNNTPTIVNKVTVEAVLNLKNGGQTTLRGFPLVSNLEPGNKACFDIYIVEPKEVQSYAVKVLSYATGGLVPGGVQPVVADAGYDAQNGWYSVSGTISSAEPVIMNDLRAVVTLFDESGRVLGCEQSFVHSQTEEADAPAAFSVLFMNRDFSQASSYSVSLAGSSQ